MPIEIEEENLKQGLLGLVVALVEIIAEVLKHQAVKRLSSGRLSEESVERLGQSIMDIEETIERIKKEQDLEETVEKVRDSLDSIIDEFLDSLVTYE